MKYVVLFFALFVFACSTKAQTYHADSLAARKIDEITVVASRISMPLNVLPGAVLLVNSKELSEMPRGIAVDEALRLVPGVRIDNQANGERVHMSIRGQGILSERGLRGIRVMIDGIPVNDPTGFASDLYDVEWLDVKHIEVLRGPSASLYGSSSNAGVLNIITQNGGPKPVNGTIVGSTGSNGFHKLLGQIDGTVNHLDYRITASGTSGFGYRDHSAFRGNLLNEKINWKASDRLRITQILQLTGYINQNAEGLNLAQLSNPKQANPDAIPCNEYQKTRRITHAILAQYQLSEGQSLKLSAFLRQTQYKEPGSSAVQYRSFQSPGASFEYSLHRNRGKVTNHFLAGLDLQWQTINELKLPNIKQPGRTEKKGAISEAVTEDTFLLANQTISQRNAGLFIVNRLELGEKLNFTASIRYDDIGNRLDDRMNRLVKLSGEADFSRLTAQAGLAYSISSQMNVFVNWGLGFLPPATEELASNPDSYGGFNKNLTAATSHGEEAGIRGSLRETITYDITGFLLFTSNDFYRYRILPARPLETFYGNAGSSKRYGLEVWFRFTPVESLSVEAAYTFSHFTYTSPDSINGVWLPNSPQHQLNAEIDYAPVKAVSIGLGADCQSHWYIYTDRVHSKVSQGGFALFQAHAGYFFRVGNTQAELSLAARNLLNARYIAFTEPDPDGNSYQPGPGREFFCTLKFRF